MFGRRSKNDQPKSKRLGASKKRNGIFQRRKNNNVCATPDGMDNITTPNVHDIPRQRHEDKKEEKPEIKPKLTKKEEYELEFGTKYVRFSKYAYSYNYICYDYICHL